MRQIRIPIPAVDFQPPVYHCNRVTSSFVLNGRLDKEFWENADYTDAFLDIEGAHMPLPRFMTRAKMLWDDTSLYIGAELDGDEIWGYLQQHDSVIFQDNDFEIFIDPDSDTQQYYEIEMNVLNTIWDLFIPVAYRDGGSGVNGYDVKGIRSAVYVDGQIGVPSADNRGWSAEIVIPFSSITECLLRKQAPQPGEYYRMNFSRVQWKTNIENGKYVKRTDPETGKQLPEDNWVWAPTGVINIHYPELWGFVFFVDEHTAPCSIPEDEYRKWELRKLYYAQQICRDTTGRFTSEYHKLLGILKEYAPIEQNGRVKPLDYRIEITPNSFEISCPSSDGRHRIVLLSNGKVCTAKN